MAIIPAPSLLERDEKGSPVRVVQFQIFDSGNDRKNFLFVLMSDGRLFQAPITEHGMVGHYAELPSCPP